jgi:hypothetical protein
MIPFDDTAEAEAGAALLTVEANLSVSFGRVFH